MKHYMWHNQQRAVPVSKAGAGLALITYCLEEKIRNEYAGQLMHVLVYLDGITIQIIPDTLYRDTFQAEGYTVLVTQLVQQHLPPPPEPKPIRRVWIKHMWNSYDTCSRCGLKRKNKARQLNGIQVPGRVIYYLVDGNWTPNRPTCVKDGRKAEGSAAVTAEKA